MELMTNEEAAHYLAEGTAVFEEKHGDITITYGRTGNEVEASYFVLIADASLPCPFFFIDRDSLGARHLFALYSSHG